MKRLLLPLLLFSLLLSSCGFLRPRAQSDFGQPIPTPVLPPGVNVSIDSNQRFQVIDGFGVNLNGAYWNDGAMAPALDFFVDEMGATLFRLITETDQWETVNDDPDPNNFNWQAYDAIYRNAHFQELWAIMRHLEAANPQAQIIFSVMGTPPAWLGDGELEAAMEAEWVEMITSMVIYAREREGLRLNLISPLNEVDLGPPEGPKMAPAQFVRVLRQLSERLAEVGHGDVKFVTPDLAFSSGTDNYLRPLLRDATVMNQMAHVASHDYAGNVTPVDDLLRGTAYTDRTFWITEYSQWCTDCDKSPDRANEWSYGADTAEFLLRYFQRGVSGAVLYDGLDGFYPHHGTFDYWGVLAYEPETGEFSPRPRFFTSAHLFRLVRPGMQRVALTSDAEAMQLSAFLDPQTGDMSIVGRNATANPVTLTLTFGSAAPTQPFTLYETTADQFLAATPLDQSLSVQVAADSIFAISTLTP